MLSTALFSCLLGIADVGTAVDGETSQQQSLESSARQLEQQFLTKLNRLAEICDEQDLPKQAAITREWRHLDHRRQYIYVPPLGKAEAVPELPIAKKWYKKFREVRADYAKKLFALSKEAAKAGNAPLSYRMLNEVVREHPGHEQARKMLGHRKVGRTWQAGSQRMTMKRSRQAHPRLGWRPNSYWRIESPHFRIVTNDTRAAGVKLAEKLERFEVVWRQLFFDYWSDSATLRAVFDGRATLPRRRSRYQIVLFRNRQEYTQYLSASEPQIGMTLGYYGKQARKSFFFSGDESSEETWLHETTHQLFHESNRGSIEAGENSNFWVMEGIALYVESLREHNGFVTLGGIEADRLQFARYRALQQGFFVPLTRICTFGRLQMQSSKDIRELYSQSAGLSHFLMDADQGKYRDRFVRFIHEVHRGKDDVDSLPRIMKDELSKLEKEYIQFLDVTDQDLKAVPSSAEIRKLAIGKTAVTDVGMASVSLSQVDWLDLTDCPIGDKTVARLESNPKINQLSLEGTKITDETLTVLGKLDSLDELDLSRTSVTDRGVAKLANLQKLEILWLTGTDVSDDCVEYLAKLKSLRQLEVTGTQITSAGVERLRAALPNLE